MKRRWFKSLALAVSILFVSGCGGKSSGDGNATVTPTPTVSPTPTETPTPTISGKAQLGFIANGTVRLYKIDDLTLPLSTTQTSTSDQNDKAGTFELKDVNIDEEQYYLLSVNGGRDIDPDDDGVIDADYSDLNGTAFAIVKGKELKNGITINALTDIFYRLIKSSLQTMQGSQIQATLDEIAKEYVEDINQNGTIEYQDVLDFDPVQHHYQVVPNYQRILNYYISGLHEDRNESAMLQSLFYANPPKIIFEKGSVQIAPCMVKPAFLRLPKDLEVKWYVDDTLLTPSTQTLTKSGVYSVDAEVYYQEELVYSHSSLYSVLNPVYAGKIEATVEDGGYLLITDANDSQLNGAEIMILPDALEQNKEINVSYATTTVASQDNDDKNHYVSASDVLIMEPSGLHFKKPVQITLPYDGDFNTSLRIARYSDDGTIDYLPIKSFDEKNKKILFETDHFTAFTLDNRNILVQTPSEKAIIDLQEITGKKYKDEKLVELLNYPISDNGETLYDMYLAFKFSQTAYTAFNSKKDYIDVSYVRMHKEAFKDPLLLKGYANILNGYNTYKTAKSYYKKTTSALDLAEALYNGDKAGATDSILRLAGIIPLTPVDLAKKYVDYVIRTAVKMLDAIKTIGINAQIKRYFDLRIGKSAEELLKTLHKSKDSKEVINEGDIMVVGGWFHAGGYAQINDSVPNGFWESVELLYLAYTNYDETESKKYLKEIFDTSYTAIEESKKSSISHTRKDSIFSTRYIKKDGKFSVSVSFDVRNITNFNSKVDFSLFDIGEKLLYSEQKGCRVDGCDFVLNAPEAKGYYSYKLKIQSESKEMKDTKEEKGYFNVLETFTINNYEIKAEMTNNEKYRVFLTPKIVDESGIEVKAIGYKSSYAIANNSSNMINFDNSIVFESSNIKNLKNVKVRFDPASNDVDMQSKEFTIDITSKIEEIQKNALVEAHLSISEVDKKPVSNGQQELTIFKDQVVTFSLINTKDISKILYEDMDGDGILEATSTKINEPILISRKFTKTGDFYPQLRVQMSDNTIKYITAPHIEVIEKQNTTPIANNQTLTVNGNATKAITLSGLDIDGDTLSFSIISAPTKGTLSGTAPNLIYTPKENIDTSDSFTFRVNDGKTDSSTATVYITTTKVIVKQLKLEGESEPKDGTYVDRGQTYTKSWTFKNNGNIDLSGFVLVAVPNQTDSELQVNEVESLPNTLAINATYTLKINISVPLNARAGTHKAVYKLADNKGNLYYSNGNQAIFWYELNLKESNPLQAYAYMSSSTYDTGEEAKLIIGSHDGNPPYKVKIDWDEGSDESGSMSQKDESKSFSHTYSSEGKKSIKVSVTDNFGKSAQFILPLTIANETKSQTSWYGVGSDLSHNTRTDNIPIDATPKENYAIYTTSWTPQPASNDYWTAYRLPVPKGALQTNKKLRITLGSKAGLLPDHDRVVTLTTTDNISYSYTVVSDVNNANGFLRIRDFNNGTNKKQEISSLTDSASYVSSQSRYYAVEMLASGMISAYKYQDNQYTNLDSTALAYSGTGIREIAVEFKGNGKLQIIVLEYDLDGDGEYNPSTEKMIFNTTDMQVDWSRFVLVDSDSDNDGANNKTDNCPNTYNPDQNDTDGDGVGDVCEVVATSFLKKTGQTTIYTNYDDGYYQKGITPNYTRDDTSEIITDHITGLMWQDNAEASTITKPWVTQANYDAKDYSNTTGDTATTYCENLTLGGYSDWRLPTIDELESIVDYGKYYPATDPILNVSSSNNYWSSTTVADYSYNAWIVGFNYGYVNFNLKDYSNYVRCVRAGE